ncbi:Ribonuclease H-like superfamily [Sesbania bispinosa]|nr:Ribonuclease H-like superfamily [Sesbania bispinosa]
MGVGGLFRDRSKQWLGGFSGTVGCKNSLEAEMLVVISVLRFAWSLSSRNLILESDSLEVVNFWSIVDFIYVFREGNLPADFWTCQGALCDHQVLWLDDPPSEVSTLILMDALSSF